MKIYLDNNLGVTNVEQEELTQDTIGYNILKVYIPNAVLTPYDTFTCYYGALLQNGRKVGWFAMEARTSSDADYEANYTLYKATLEQCVVSVEGKVYIGCQVLLGNSGNATLIKKNTAVVQFNVRKSVAINNDILVLDTDQTTTDVLESYKNLLKNALTTYATKATTYTKTEVDGKLDLKADKSDIYTKDEINNYKKMWDNLVYSCEFTIDDSAKTMTISGNWAFTKYSFIVIYNIAVKTISYANLSLGNYCLVIRNNALEFVNFANAIQDGDMVLWIGFLDGTGSIRTDIYRCNNKVTNLALYCSDNIKIDTTNKNFVIPSAYLFWNSGYASITAQNISYASYLNATCVLVYRNGVFKVLGLQNIELFYNDVIVAVVWFRSDGFPMSKIYVVNEAPDKAITELPLSSKIFMRVGVIGDSYTSGWIKDNDHKNNPNYSWVKYMKQLTGNEWTNFGVSGSSTKSWVDGTLGQLPQVQTKGNKCQAYVIGLMINDQNQGMQTYVPLGTSSDIGTNANSYYAYYYKLINALLSVNSSAIIFCNTCPRTDGDFPSYNQAVIDVVNYCQSESKNVYLVELRNYYWRNETFNNDALNGHYTAIGYEYMAEIFNKAFSDTINANASSLKEVNLIPYDSATVYDYVDNKINNTNTQLEITNDKVTTLQDDVADLKSVQNVVAVVATKSALNSYDTSKLDVDDKVQVIADETHDGASTIYNWNGTQWQYVGAFGGNSYTKAETYNKTQIDSALSDKADKSNTYTRAVIDSMILTLSTDKADKSDTYTKTEEDAKFEEVGAMFEAVGNEVLKKADKADTYTKQEVNDKLDGYIKDNDTTYSATVRGKEVIVSTGAGYGSTTYGHSSISIGNPRKPTCDYYFPDEKSGTLALTSDIPTVNNPTITFTQGGTTKGSISLNQASDQTIALDAGGSGGSSVVANPTLDGTEAHLGGLEVDGVKYSNHLYQHSIIIPNINSKKLFLQTYYSSKGTAITSDEVTYTVVNYNQNQYPFYCYENNEPSNNKITHIGHLYLSAGRPYAYFQEYGSTTTYTSPMSSDFTVTDQIYKIF